MIRNVKELWLELSRLAHFDDTAYDRELKIAIAQRLNLGQGNITDELERCKVTNKALLTAVLEAMQPFSQMMADLLRTYVAAGAVSNENNIQILFDFDGVPTEYNLSEFSKQVRQIQERISLQTELLDPWTLISVFRDFDGGGLNNVDYHYRRDYKNLPEEIQNWLNEYRKDKLPEHLPSFPEVRDRRLNERLKQVEDLVEASLQRYNSEYTPSKGLRESIRQGCEKHRTKFWYAETDYWLGNFVCEFYLVASYFRNMPPNRQQQHTLVGALDRFFDSKAVRKVTFLNKYEALCDILDMPFWKYRYEMYSAWVFTCISDTVSDLGLSYYVEDGVLSFRFSGSLLATLNLPGVIFEIWAEKRHLAVNPEGSSRKFNIQPDYTIIKRCGDAETTSLIIECKQYKRPNTANFSNAVNDYALACQYAKVLLVNYGRISNCMTRRLKPTVLNRYTGYSCMRPGEMIQDVFCKEIREAIEANWIDAQPDGDEDIYLWEKRPEQIKIELFWGELPQDLDLEVRIKDPRKTTICYKYMGQIDKYPFAKLNQDMRRGPGTETVTIRKIIAGEYEIYVNNYSGEKKIEGEVKVRVRSEEDEVYYTKKGIWEMNKIWYVGSVNAIGVTKMDVMILSDK